MPLRSLNAARTGAVGETAPFVQQWRPRAERRPAGWTIMKLLFVADPLETFKTYKDTTFAMMREAAARGHALLACEPKDLVWQRGGRVSAKVRAIALAAPSSAAWFVETAAPVPMALADADAVLMRKDPPFDSEYFYATHLLEQAEREGGRVFNSPRALRDHPEKLAILEFRTTSRRRSSPATRPRSSASTASTRTSS